MVTYVLQNYIKRSIFMCLCSKLRFTLVLSDDLDSVLEDMIKMCDVTLMMGAPIPGKCRDSAASLATTLSKFLSEKYNAGQVSVRSIFDLPSYIRLFCKFID